jgi:hypothetical protein
MRSFLAGAPSILPGRKRAVCLEWQDTIVRDPFFHRVPAFFNMSMKEIFLAKHPTSWMEFEKGLIDDRELYRRFFTDGRPIDGPGMLKDMVRVLKLRTACPEFVLQIRPSR